ncbi:MAG TPA: response regulator transcription factor [bacterium]|nr:response regulator transcription factor [bacterium]
MRILLVDDHAVIRKGLARLIADEISAAVIGEAGSAAEALTELALQKWELLILDIFMPGSGGLTVLDEVRRLYPELPVLVLSSAPEEQMAVRVLKAGARGYLNKQCAPEELVSAIRKVMAHGRYISAATAERLAGDVGRTEKTPQEELSDREYTVLRMLVAGRSIKDIAAELNVSPKTVSTFHTRIWHKLRVTNDADMVRYALEHDIF